MVISVFEKVENKVEIEEFATLFFTTFIRVIKSRDCVVELIENK